MRRGKPPLWLAGVGGEGLPELEKDVSARLGKALDRSGMLEIAQGMMGNALGILNFAQGAHNCRCGGWVHCGVQWFCSPAEAEGKDGVAGEVQRQWCEWL